MSALTKRSPRRVGAVAPMLAVTILVLVVLGCGKGQYRPSAQRGPHPVRTVRGGSPREAGPARAPTAAAARAFARVVNLTAADVPGATPAPRPRPEGEDAKTRRCGGTVNDTGAVQARSPNLARGTALTREEISSQVTVLANAKLASESIAAIRRPSWRACYERSLRHHFALASSTGIRVQSIRVSSIPVDIRGVEESFGVRILAKLSSVRSNLSIALYLDVFGFAVGPAEIDMDATSYVQAEPARTEHDLLQLMDDRAQLHPL